MPRLNCWEFKKCGRQPGGAKVAELGVCPAATEDRVSGVNGGVNGGRVCWYIAGTLCGGQVQGTFASKLSNCMQCEFYQSAIKEEGPDAAKASAVLAMLGCQK
jgi:hypothetical protein